MSLQGWALLILTGQYVFTKVGSLILNWSVFLYKGGLTYSQLVSLSLQEYLRLKNKLVNMTTECHNHREGD